MSAYFLGNKISGKLLFNLAKKLKIFLPTDFGISKNSIGVRVSGKSSHYSKKSDSPPEKDFRLSRLSKN